MLLSFDDLTQFSQLITTDFTLTAVRYATALSEFSTRWTRRKGPRELPPKNVDSKVTNNRH